MPGLALARHPLGLSAAHAAEFAALVGSTEDAGTALEKAGGDRAVAHVLREAKAPDAIAVLSRLVPVTGEVATLRRALAGAASYPVALLASTALAAWAIWAVSLPALVTVGADPFELRLAQAAALIVSLGALVALSIVTARGLRVPGFSRGHALLDRALVLDAAAVLVEEKVPLDRAVAAAGAAVQGPIQEAAKALAWAFGSGSAPGAVEALLSRDAAGILGASAAKGVAASVLRALAGQALLEAQRDVPAQVRRVQLVALLCAGAAVMTLAIGWYQSYVHAVVG